MDTVIEFVIRNRLGCEIGRFEVERDDMGAPLTMQAFDGNVDFRFALETLEPGDTLSMEDRWSER